MQSNTSAVETITGDKDIINSLFGGLSIAPYGIFLLLSAYAFAQGWINWETNGGPPYLGGVLAWLLDKLIRWYYRKKYDFVFGVHKSEPTKTNSSAIKSTLLILVVLVVIGLLAAWYIDSNFHPQIRFVLIGFGILVCLRGVDWVQKSWTGYGLIHILLGIFPIGMSMLPLILNISSNNRYFGFEGIYELSAIGFVIISVGIMEHFIFLNARNPALD